MLERSYIRHLNKCIYKQVESTYNTTERERDLCCQKNGWSKGGHKEKCAGMAAEAKAGCVGGGGGSGKGGGEGKDSGGGGGVGGGDGGVGDGKKEKKRGKKKKGGRRR